MSRILEAISRADKDDVGRVEELHVDIDTVLLNDKVRELCLKHSIAIVPYAVHAPAAHGMVEGQHKHLWRFYRIALHAYNQVTGKTATPEILDHALLHAAACLNRRVGRGYTQTPYELRHDKKPQLGYYFAQRVITQIRPTPSAKSADRGMCALYMGQVEGSDNLHTVLIEYNTASGNRVQRVVVSRTVRPITTFEADFSNPGPPRDVPDHGTAEEYPETLLRGIAATLWQEDSSDECAICTDGGELIMCSYCPQSFHGQCLGLSEEEVMSLPAHYRCPTCSGNPMPMQPPTTTPARARTDTTPELSERDLRAARRVQFAEPRAESSESRAAQATAMAIPTVVLTHSQLWAQTRLEAITRAQERRDVISALTQEYREGLVNAEMLIAKLDNPTDSIRIIRNVELKKLYHTIMTK